MDIKVAAEKLGAYLESRRVCEVLTVGIRRDHGEILVYLAEHLAKGEKIIPEKWEGFTVLVRVSGRAFPAGRLR